MSGKYQAYPEYKDSGVEWLGKLPTNWGGVRLKYLAPIVTEKATDRRNPLGLENIESWTGKLQVTDSEFQGDGTRFIAGDLLFGKLRPYLAKVLLAQSEGEAVGDFHVLRPLHNDSRYLQYQMLTREFISIVDGSTYGAKMPRASWEFMGNLTCSRPSLIEQRTIAAFLDHETARIDRLIEKQQRLIELLREKRQAVISHAVTKGLDPNVPMKDSGVEWLGQVPEHWRVVQARHLIRLMEQGKSPECEARTVENDEWGVLKTGCVNGGIYRASEHKALPVHIPPHTAYEVQSGDILMSRASGSRDLIGAVAYVDKTPPRLLLSDKVFRLILEAGVHPKFFTMLMGSKTVRAQVELAINGAEGLANNITKESIKSFVVALPSHAEQRDICEHLSEQSKTFAKLEGRLSHALVLLQERRTALISAAVTGKIDVRNWQPNTSTQSDEPDLPLAAEQAGRYHV